MYKLGIIGVGKMGGSILKGIISSNLMKKEDILLCFHSEDSMTKYKNDGYQVTCDINDIYKDCEVILLSIKPQSFDQSLIGSKEYDFSNKGVISVAAGVSISYLEEYFKNASIIRSMPNTPSLIGCGVTTICYNYESRYTSLAKDIFSSIGSCYVVKENQMDETLPLNGSMPAYLYYFAKQFIDNAVSQGIDYQTAKQLTANSIIASANMILTQEDDIETLIKNVCSKGGTTIEGLKKLDDRFTSSLEDCYKSCVKRSKEMKK